MLIRSLLLVLSAFIFSGCSLFDYFIIADSETSVSEDETGEAPPNLAWEEHIFDLGSFCWTGGNVGICVDKIPPEYTEAQHLAVSDTMVLVFAEPFPNSVSLSLYPGSNLSAQEAIPLDVRMNENGEILLALPENLQGLYVLAVFATWDGGDAFYTLPISLQ